jgi:gliding motility-associated-like protein
MKYIRKLILLILFSLAYNVQAQYILSNNLVQNPSFEQYDNCPDNLAQLYKSKYWWGLSSEYFNICNIGNVSVPLNIEGFQNARTGFAYAGFLLHYHSPNTNNKVYIETIKNILNDSLKKNSRYCIDYYMSLAEYTFIYIGQPNVIVNYDSIGAMLTINQVKDTTIAILCDTCAKFTKSVIGIDTANWYKISGSIIANGGEKYLTIGNFQDAIYWPTGVWGVIYVFIDDISVCECGYNINLGEDTTLCEGESLILNPNLPNATYTWQDSSHTATYEAKQSGTYWVRAYVAEYDITTTDTIVITAGDDSFCNPPLTIPNVITPNGDSQNDNFVLPNAEYYDIALQIYNRWGVIIYESVSYKNDFSCKECADGVYYYVLKAKSKRNGREKEYKGSLTIING